MRAKACAQEVPRGRCKTEHGIEVLRRLVVKAAYLNIGGFDQTMRFWDQQTCCGASEPQASMTALGKIVYDSSASWDYLGES